MSETILGLSVGNFVGTVMILAVWEIIWKAIGLWHAARKDDKLWFIIILVVNLVGIIPIVYLAMNTDFFKKLAKKLSK